MKIKYFLVVAVLATAIFGFGGATNIYAAGPTKLSDCTNATFEGGVGDEIACIQGLIPYLQAQLPSQPTGSISNLMLQIQILQAQLQLQQLQQGITPPTAWCHTFNSNLGYANSGSSEVGYLHTSLTKESISYSGDTSNEYGEATMSAVIGFQEKYGIKQTGYVGPATRAKLNSFYGCGVSSILPTINFTANGSIGPVISTQGGQNFNLVWTSTNANTCYAYANSVLMNNVVVDGITNNFQGQTSGTILVTPRADITYKITCSNFTGQQTSNSITFQVLTTTQPTITLISPNGGESWKVGETHNITWTSNGLSSGAALSIGLNGDGQTSTMTGAQIVTNIPVSNGSYSWTIPSILGESLAGKSYKIYATWYSGNQNYVGDTSNNYFSITSSTANLTPTVSFTASNSNGQLFNTNTISIQVGETVNFAYSSTNADSCYAYVNSSLINSTPPGFNQGATSGNWETLARVAGINATYTVTCTNANGQQASRSIILSSIPSVTEEPDISYLLPSVVSVGSPVTIYGNNFHSSDSVLLYLSTNRNVSVSVNPTSVSTSGTSETFTVPSTLAPGSYEVAIFASGSQISSNTKLLIINSVSNTTCTSFTYSAWSACSSTGNQTRTVTSSYPTGCVGNSLAALSQGCTPTPTCTQQGTTCCLGDECNVVSLNCTTGHVSSFTGCNSRCEAQASCVDSPTTSSFTITSPNGGETWAQGTTHNITWTGQGSMTTSDLAIYIVDPNGNSRVITNPLTPGLYSWTIPSYVLGQYKVYIYDTYHPSTPLDISDNYFNVIAPVALNASQYKLASISDAIVKMAAIIQSMLGK